jgi:alkylation response protein AidB-like acyl-CoA dehydrogenase
MPWYGIQDREGVLWVTSAASGVPGRANSQSDNRLRCREGTTREEVSAALKGLEKPSGVHNAVRERVAVLAERLAKAGLLHWRSLPRRPATTKRPEKLQVRLTEANMAMLKARAAEAGLTITDYVISRCCGKPE